MDAITRAQLNEHAARQQSTGLPLSWLLFLCGAWTCLGLVFALWSVLLGAAVLLVGLALTGALYVISNSAPEVEYESPPPVERSSARAPSTAFVALGEETNAKNPTARRAPPIPRSVTLPKAVAEELPENSFKAFASKNPKLLIQSQRQYLERLRAKTETDILVLEPVLRARLHKNRKEELEGFLEAQQIVKALDVRVKEIDKAQDIEDWSEETLQRFWQLCYGKLELKNDAMNTLHSEIEARVILVTNCEQRLADIFRLLKRRQTFFRALEDKFHLTPRS